MKTVFKLSLYTLVLFVAVAMVASSCKKEEIVPTRVHTVSHGDTQGNVLYTHTYSYDDQYRLVEVKQDDSVVATFRYNDLSVIQTNGAYTTVYALNTDGYVTSANFSYLTLTTFYYGAIGYADYTEQSGIRSNYTWSGENLVSVYGSDTVVYTYLSDKFTTIGNEYTGQAFLGKDSKNLVSTITYNTNAATVTFTYEYDGQGRVTKRTNGSIVETYTYY